MALQCNLMSMIILGTICLSAHAADPQAFVPLRLTPIADNAKLGQLTRPPSGIVTLGNVPFNLTQPYQTFHSEGPGHFLATAITMAATVPAPSAVYVLISGDYVGKFHDKEVGSVILSFDDGSEVRVPLKVGTTLRETWGFDDEMPPLPDDKVIGSIDNARLINVYAEKQSRGRPATASLDMLAIDLGQTKADTTLTEITIRDSSRQLVKSVAPALIVYSITVERVPNVTEERK